MLTKQDLSQIGDIVDGKLFPVEKRINKRLDTMDKRLDNMDKRLDGMDKRLDTMDKRFDGMDKRLGNMENKIDQILHYSKTVADELVLTQTKVDNHETRITKLENSVFA